MKQEVDSETTDHLSLQITKSKTEIYTYDTPHLYIFVQKYTEKIIKRFLSLSVKSLHFKYKKTKVKTLALLRRRRQTDANVLLTRT